MSVLIEGASALPASDDGRGCSDGCVVGLLGNA